MRKYVQMICDYNFNKDIQAKVEKIAPIDKDNMFIHKVLKEWGPEVE